MSDLVGNPEDLFSHDAALFVDGHYVIYFDEYVFKVCHNIICFI